MRNRIHGLRILRKQWIISLFMAAFLIFAGGASEAATTLYTDFDLWNTALSGYTVETFITLPANIALADEVISTPDRNTDVGQFLTFQAANTGLLRGFTVQTLQSNAHFTFDDDEKGIDFPLFDNALSVGDMDNHEDDDWRLSLLDGAGMTAFGVKVIDNNYTSGETFSLFYNNSLIETVDLFGLGSYQKSNNFLGIISDSVFDRVDFNEGDDGDDIAIADFRFASANSPVAPEPVSSILFVTGGILLAGRRFLKKKVKA